MPLNDKNRLKNVILKFFPEFKNSNFIFNYSGWTSVVVEVDNSFICKFPRTPEKNVFLKKEHILIDKLSNFLSGIEFPQRSYINAEIPFFIHKKIDGLFITPSYYDAFSFQEKQNYVNSIANFFIDLHACSVTSFQDLLPVKNEVLPSAEFLLNAIHQDFSLVHLNILRKALVDFQNLKDVSPKILGYYDFHPYNVLFDKNSKKIKGIFDFDEMSIGSSKFDLREIFLNYNFDIGKNVLESYNQKASFPITLKTVQTVLLGWAVYEYYNMKKRLNNGELNDVQNLDLKEFNSEINQMILTYNN